MIDFIRRWVLGMTAAGLIAAVFVSLTPKGKMRKVTKLASAFLIIAAMVSPVLDFDFTSFSSALTDYRALNGDYSKQFDKENDRLMLAIIEERSAAYISDKAISIGVKTISVDVTAKKTEDSTYPSPYEAEISADCTEKQKTELTRYIEGEIGIPEERQYWGGANGT